MLTIGIPIFPGSNCDRDVHYVLTNIYKVKTDLIWHKKENIKNYDAIILPGGFSFGDRLRAGIIAAHSPIIKEVKRLGNQGIPILGICNESGNILGMMPHPERSCQNELEIVGLTSKAMRIFDSLMNFLKK